MTPFAQCPDQTLKAVDFVLADIDDTITTDGRLPATSLHVMERLQDTGVRVIPVTGRPAGWCDHIARMWPVDAVVGENGAFWFAYDRDARKMRSTFARSDIQRRVDRTRLDALRDRILDAVPGAGIASDQFCRLADLAIDFCEDVTPLPAEDVARIVALFEAEGCVAKVSSIHVNGWFGDYDKLRTARQCMAAVFDVDLNSSLHRMLFIGDSPNDQPMFAFFRNSVGVANVRDFALDNPPSWITAGRAADGFREMVERLLAARC